MANGTTIPGSMFLESPGGVFKVAITSPDPSSPTPAYMLAIFYAKASENKIIWVPNRLPVLSSTNASFTLTASGELRVYDGSGEETKVVWNSNTGGVSTLHIPLGLHS